MDEIVFEITPTSGGGYDARAVGHSIFTPGSDWADLKAMVKDAMLRHFDDEEAPTLVRLRLVQDEVMA